MTSAAVLCLAYYVYVYASHVTYWYSNRCGTARIALVTIVAQRSVISSDLFQVRVLFRAVASQSAALTSRHGRGLATGIATIIGIFGL